MTRQRNGPPESEVPAPTGTGTHHDHHVDNPDSNRSGRRLMTRPADEPQFNIGENASRHGLVHISIGTGMGGYNITPERAEELADELLDAAHAARAKGQAAQV